MQAIRSLSPLIDSEDYLSRIRESIPCILTSQTDISSTPGHKHFVWWVPLNRKTSTFSRLDLTPYGLLFLNEIVGVNSTGDIPSFNTEATLGPAILDICCPVFVLYNGVYFVAFTVLGSSPPQFPPKDFLLLRLADKEAKRIENLRRQGLHYASELLPHAYDALNAVIVDLQFTVLERNTPRAKRLKEKIASAPTSSSISSSTSASIVGSAPTSSSKSSSTSASIVGSAVPASLNELTACSSYSSSSSFVSSLKRKVNTSKLL